MAEGLVGAMVNARAVQAPSVPPERCIDILRAPGRDGYTITTDSIILDSVTRRHLRVSHAIIDYLIPATVWPPVLPGRWT